MFGPEMHKISNSPTTLNSPDCIEKIRIPFFEWNIRALYKRLYYI